jgi:hypothetical protein
MFSNHVHSNAAASEPTRPAQTHICNALLTRTKSILQLNQEILRELLTAAIQASRRPDTAAAAKLHIRALMHQAAMLQQLKSGTFLALKPSNKGLAPQVMCPVPRDLAKLDACSLVQKQGSNAMPSPSYSRSQNSSSSESGHFTFPTLASQASLSSSLSSGTSSPPSQLSHAMASDSFHPLAAITSTSNKVSSQAYSRKRDSGHLSSSSGAKADQESCSLLCTESSEMMGFSPVGKKQRAEVKQARGLLPASAYEVNSELINVSLQAAIMSLRMII